MSCRGKNRVSHTHILLLIPERSYRFIWLWHIVAEFSWKSQKIPANRRETRCVMFASSNFLSGEKWAWWDSISIWRARTCSWSSLLSVFVSSVLRLKRKQLGEKKNWGWNENKFNQTAVERKMYCNVVLFSVVLLLFFFLPLKCLLAVCAQITLPRKLKQN